MSPTQQAHRKLTETPTSHSGAERLSSINSLSINRVAIQPHRMQPPELVWDNDYLYLTVTMFDRDIAPSTVVSGRGGFDGPLYEGDVIELFVREQASSPQYHEFEWSPNGDEFDARFDSVRFGAPGTRWDSGMMSAVTVDGTTDVASDEDHSWTVEAAIPLSHFATRDEWFFTFARYDYHPRDGGGYDADLMMSTPGDPDAPRGGVTHGFHTYEIYDVMVFVPEPQHAILLPLALAACFVSRHRV